MSSREVTVNKSFLIKMAINVAIVAIGVVFVVGSFDVSPGFQQIVGADQYSRAVASLLTVLGILGVGRAVLDYRKGAFDEEELKIVVEMRRAGKRIGALFLLLILNIYLIRIIGYFESGFVFLTLAIFVLGDKTRRRFLQAVAFALLITAIVYVVFGVMLNIYLPRGLLIN